ncbi:non-ribosomal peptide synthetase [Nocardia terpenica]|uniref:Amino acid adenylation domain-containing protein n=1 Tax=Nocardia terpenica TaxID=455432 RepID=A0A6G9ZD80_9NOCA|nr:non-ribosomal peptide synthetase [Nocardia terpenica]QIS23390.1 amino acid adenylation domain-containing protein [Nocardia terpenica]
MTIQNNELDADDKRALLRKLLQERAARSTERELSHGERGLWLHSRMAPDSASYNLLYVGSIPATIDHRRLESALTALANRHETLRTEYREADGRAIADVRPRAEIPLHTIDATAWDSRWLEHWLDHRLEQRIDLGTGPLLEATVLNLGTHQLLVLAIPHIAIDFWSFDILLTELCILYADPARPLPPIEHRYVDHIRWQDTLLASDRGRTLWDYWTTRLAGDLPRLELPGRRPRPAVQTFTGRTHHFEFDATQTATLRRLAREEGVTLQITVLAAYIALLHRYSGNDDIIVGSPTASRGMPGSERMIGYFINAVALRSNLGDDPGYRTLLQRTRETVLEAVEHQDLPFALLAERLVPVRGPAYPPVFQVFFAWETSRVSTGSPTAELPEGLALDTVTLRQGGAPLDVILQVVERENTLSAVLQYNTDLFDTDTIGRFADHLRTLTAGAVADPDLPIGRVPILTPAEKAAQAQWNDTRVDRFRDHCLHTLIAEQVRRTPEHIAITFRDRHIHYRDLQDRAERLAARLQAAGAGPGAVVGIALHRSEMSVIAAYAVLLTGAAFLPVDPRHPAQRLRTIAEEAAVAVWVTDSTSSAELPADYPLLFADVLQRKSSTARFDPDAARVCPDDIAYVMFTSGSTGTPKGALNTHRGIANRLLWMQDAYPLTAEDSVLHKTPANFDVSVWELLWPLLTGARVVVAEPDGHRDSGYLVEAIVDNEITVTHFVPSMLRAFLADPGASRCTGLRRVITSGEALTADLRDDFFATLPASLHNLYGPTEAAIDVTSFDCVRGDHDPIVPIGRPIANTRMHILNRDMSPCPVGVTGDLYIGGIGVARGYVNRPELTAQRFLHDPHTGATEPDDVLYRTGDLARYRPDGTIEYLGRSDNQVKIRGVRIELTEIESALTASSTVREAAVVARTDTTGTAGLVAYIVPAYTAAPPRPEDLRALLRRSLPEAMLPTRFVTLERIPTTANGKRDDRALPEPDTGRPDIAAEYRPPRDGTDATLAELWQIALGIDRVGILDDFFDLGGASTQIIQVCAGARERGIPLTPEIVFRHRTIAAIADAVATNGAPAFHTPVRPTAGTVDDTPAPAAHEDIETPGPAADVGESTVIESIGVYLPDQVLSTADVVTGCDRPVQIPLEELTGIRTRRVVEAGEFASDLAGKAAERCLAMSRYAPNDIDLLICTNISKIEGPDSRFIFEPSTSMRLRSVLGLGNALSFDISNACAGMFTGIWVADTFLRLGVVRTAMVVSGEYISHITRTAQREIVDFLDDRLACLTVGDAGAAVILERSDSGHCGFHDLRLRTLSKYSHLCIGKQTDQLHGGAIMHTKAVEQTAVAVRKSVPFATRMLEGHGWSPESIDHILMHQTSKASITDASTTINRLFGRTVAHPDNTICNLEHRGNTASTTHFVAINDLVDQGRLAPGDRMLFGITGSGQTIGAALYTFDDLPRRMQQGTSEETARATPDTGLRPDRPRVRIDAIATATPRGEDTAVELAVEAAGECLARSGVAKEDIGLLLYAGTFRDEYMVEPATATFVAGRLEINDDPDDPFDRGTLACDVMDGPVGLLKACHIATNAVQAGAVRAALVVAAEADPDQLGRAAERRGIAHAGSALLLAGTDDGSGFGEFHFAVYPEDLDAVSSYTRMHDGAGLQVCTADGLQELYLKHLDETITEFLVPLRLSVADFGVICAPQISAEFLDALAERLGVARDRFIDISGDADLFTSSVPMALRHCRDTGRVRRGERGLIVTVGAGIQVGCAIYHF